SAGCWHRGSTGSTAGRGPHAGSPPCARTRGCGSPSWGSSRPRPGPGSTDANTLCGEQLTHPAVAAIIGEDVPLLGQTLGVHQVAEPPERTLALDRLLQAGAQPGVGLPGREVGHVPPALARARTVQEQPPV